MPAVQPCGIPLVQRGQATPADLTDRMRRALNAPFTLHPPRARFVVRTRGSPRRQGLPLAKAGVAGKALQREPAPQWAILPTLRRITAPAPWRADPRRPPCNR